MLRSMTGYGRAQEIIDGRDILVEIRAVNHRYYEFSARIPRAYGYLEEKLKSFLQGKVSRGKVEVNVTIFNTEGKDALVEVNKSIAHGYINALNNVNEELNLRNDLALSHIMRLPDVFTVQKTVDDEEVIWDCVSKVASDALDKFVTMRITEGERLKADLSDKLSCLEDMVSFVEEQSPRLTENYRSKLYNKLKEILGDTNIDEQRILTEAAIFSEKVAVDEETVRLRSHISQFREMLCEDIPVGRKLDFLIQEMNRETNTIGSKAQDLSITRKVVDMKSEIEKIREQIQNIE
ncbi:MAG: YicC family protein [Oscillospiraceae bacterium]|nr:YicC family protein [Oscillospiraceae bacterium]